MDDDATEPLELTEEVGFEDGEEQQPQEETVIAFADEGEDEAEETPLVKRLRDQLRQEQRKNRQHKPATDEADPEPVVPEHKRIEDFDYDGEKLDAYNQARETAIEARAEWKVRQKEREGAHKRAQDEQTRQIEQQIRSLGVNDYDARVDKVKERLTEQQMLVLINATDNPARLMYALGRSETRLTELAGVENLAKFAARVGQMEKEVKVMKKTPPAPDVPVRGGTASTALTTDAKELERLEKEADRTGNRSKVIAYKRAMKSRQAA